MKGQIDSHSILFHNGYVGFFGLLIEKRLHARERSRLKDCKQHPALQQALDEGMPAGAGSLRGI